MSRARVTALALVNWKGVFYERYLLDRHVTALEGANGAGKTTVMIAAYVVLLPDMSRLRFTNLGESGATGGDRGIWGRLGEPGRPAYAALDVETGAGERVVAAVRLVRGAPPTVEPTAFLVHGLPPSVRLSDILLERRLDGDHVPELDDIVRAATAAGGTAEVFRTTKDYFAALFERGITPLRLASDEDRGKLNEMLRTSMTGGISRALTSELRAFLLKEETGLSDTLSRMRANLEACRRTRAEVREARHLEREISSIYEAGLAMFEAAIHAQQAAALEATQRAAAAAAAVDDADRAAQAAEQAVVELAGREGELATRAAAARLAIAAATAERDRRAAARAVAARLAAIDDELGALTARAEAARARQVAAAATRAAARSERVRAADAEGRAAQGLAHLQEGLDELVRRAHAHRALGRRLADARALTDRPALEPASAEVTAAELDGERARCHAERARLERELRDLEARRDEHGQARAALAALEEASHGGPVGDADPHARARVALARLGELELRAARAHDLDHELADAEHLAERQRAARQLADQLALPPAARSTGGAVAALAAAEAEAREAERAARVEDDALGAAREQLARLRARAAQLDADRARWQLGVAAAEAVARYAESAGDAGAAGLLAQLRAGAPAAVAAAREQLAAEHHALARQRAEVEAHRERLGQRATALAQAGAAVDPELLRLRDELGGELLAGRFEDLDVAAAGWVEARLGPLASALIVEDPEAAASALAHVDHALPSVYLVRAGSALAVEPPDEEAARERDVVSPEPHGVRVTRRSAQPTLGRRARERQLRELHASVERAGATLEQLGDRARALAQARRELEQVATHALALAAGDPADARAQLDSQIATLELGEAARRDHAGAARTRAAGARERLDVLRRLLGDAALLTAPDQAERAHQLAAQRAALSAARDELARCAAARRTLGQLVDVLRHPPLDDRAVAAASARRDALDARLDRLFHARAALEDVIAHRHAAAWADAAAALEARAGLVPALEHQHEGARRAVQAADAATATAEAAWEAATAALQEAEAARAAAAAHRDRAVAELAELASSPAAGAGGASPAAGSEEAAARAVAAAEAAAGAIEAEARALVGEQALAAERRARAHRAAADARAQRAALAREVGPVGAAWAELRARADEAGLLAAALAGAGAAALAGRTSVQLTADAWSKRELLIDRLARARGGDEAAAAVRELPLDGDGYLAAWRAARDWLRRRVPAQVAEVDDPLLALERLRDHLDLLDGRLARQEADLRGASEDVARGIDVQVRRAHGQVRRLTQQLDGIRFGSIHGIRVQMRRVERMEQILRALRSGEAQELLFLSSIPIEEALDEIFRRYGGGGRAGGQRVLDYREYLELAVEIRRQAAEAWEPASPTRLSTGEAIGVGAALMMVVLTEWERDANLLRARRAHGSLRFLFLDEANRLSRDNLGVLFDLCRSLDLQLLIAAPEVARAEGNTTYRLVRHVSDAGVEEVIVSGRRAATSDAATEPPPPPLATEPPPPPLATEPPPPLATEPSPPPLATEPPPPLATEPGATL
jgi:chromosome partition protein MukB